MFLLLLSRENQVKMVDKLVVDEIVALISGGDEERNEVVESGVVDYLAGVVNEASLAEDISSVIDIEGLKEVVDSFIPKFEEISR